jgi:Flp pilus assembly protein TadD
VTLAVAGLGVSVLAIASFVQTRAWRDSVSLWTHAARVTPTPRVLMTLGRTIKDQDPEYAKDLLRRAAEGNPTLGPAWYEYAGLAQQAGDLRAAEEGYLRAAPLLMQEYVPRVDLGILYLVTGRREEGLEQLRLAVAAVERDPPEERQGRPYMVMGLAVLEEGRRDEAAGWFRKAALYVDTHDGAVAELRKLGL